MIYQESHHQQKEIEEEKEDEKLEVWRKKMKTNQTMMLPHSAFEKMMRCLQLLCCVEEEDEEEGDCVDDEGES